MTLASIRAVIVDDEEPARMIVREHLQRFDSITVVAECANGFEAVKAITEHRPDLVFLDIQMPKLSGFEVLELVEPEFRVVFVTAHDQHALKAFEVNAVDYLLKPFDAGRFDQAVARALDALSGGEKGYPRKVLEDSAPEGPLTRIVVRTGSDVHVLPLDRVSHIVAQDDYVSIVSQGRSYLKQQAISDLADRLPTDRFVRIHRSSVINLDYLSRIELYAKDSRVVILKDGTKLNVSRSGYQLLQDRLKA